MCVSAPSVCAAHRQHTTRGQRLNSDHYAWQQGPLPTYPSPPADCSSLCIRVTKTWFLLQNINETKT